jgi:hypothetical protein
MIRFFSFLLTVVGISASQNAQAAAFLFQFSPGSVTSAQDPYYAELYRQPDGSTLDTTSRVYYSTSTFDGNQPDSPTDSIQAAMSGRHYDGDPVRGSEWGILDPESIPFTERPDFEGYVVKYGLRPQRAGSTNSTFLNSNGEYYPASYLEFSVDTADRVLFDKLSLTVSDLQAIESTNVVWAGTNVDNFTTVTLPTITRDVERETQTISFNLESVNLVGSKLLFRVYGIKGSDYGNFTAGILRGTVETPPPLVPEPNVSLFAASALFWGGTRRRRTI